MDWNEGSINKSARSDILCVADSCFSTRAPAVQKSIDRPSLLQPRLIRQATHRLPPLLFTLWERGEIRNHVHLSKDHDQSASSKRKHVFRAGTRQQLCPAHCPSPRSEPNLSQLARLVEGLIRSAGKPRDSSILCGSDLFRRLGRSFHRN